jgi:hypothetical protein
MRKFILISFAILLLGLALTTPVSAGDSPCIESCDSAGNTKDTFNPGDKVYVKGSGLEPGLSYYIYIVVDHEPWVRGRTKKDDLTIICEVYVTVDENGYIENQPVLIWDSASPGYYDIWADCTMAGASWTYDASDDLDNFDVGTAGFFVIPEIPLGVTAVLAACFAGLGVRQLPRKRKGTL